MYSCCIPVRGYCRSIIYDLNRKKYHYIPNELCDLLIKFNGHTLKDVYDYYEDSEVEMIEKCFDFLKENEIVFFADKQSRVQFPQLDPIWDSVSKINNAILDISEDTKSVVIQRSFSQLEGLLCGALQIREVAPGLSLSSITKLCENLKRSSITKVELFIDYRLHDDLDALLEIVKSENRVLHLYIYNSPVFKIEYLSDRPFGNMIFIKEDVNDIKSVQDPSLFSVNIELFNESHFHNTYFNRKIYIDASGNVRVSPETTIIYGNISDLSIDTLLSEDDFNYLWNIKKDDITGCNVCEYRYMCVDCRIPLKDEKKDSQWYFKEECAFNPFTGEWRSKT